MISYVDPHWQEWEGVGCHSAIVAWSHGHVNLDDEGYWDEALKMVRGMGLITREVWLRHGMVRYDESDTPHCLEDLSGFPAWESIFPATFVAVEDI